MTSFWGFCCCCCSLSSNSPQETDPPGHQAVKSCGQETPIRAPWRMPAQGGLTGGCHTSSAGSGLLSHTSGCTCSTRPTGSSLRPRAPGWASCSRTPPRGTTETQQGGPRAQGTQRRRRQPAGARAPHHCDSRHVSNHHASPQWLLVIHTKVDPFEEGLGMLVNSRDRPDTYTPAGFALCPNSP